MTPDALKKAARELVTAMETCHYCSCLVLVEDGPIHCEDCPSGCEHHEPPDCRRISELHFRLKRVLEASHATD